MTTSAEKEAIKRYQSTAKGKEAAKRYRTSDKGKEARKRANAKSAGKRFIKEFARLDELDEFESYIKRRREELNKKD